MKFNIFCILYISNYYSLMNLIDNVNVSVSIKSFNFLVCFLLEKISQNILKNKEKLMSTQFFIIC